MASEPETFDPESVKRYFDDFYEDEEFARFPVANRRFVRSLVRHYDVPEGGLALDVGCGTGNFSEHLSRAGLRVVGVDLSEVGLETARNRCPDGDFVAGDAFRLPFRSGSFPLLFCHGLSVFSTERLGDVRSVLEDLMEYVTDEGLFVFGYTSRLTGAERGGWQHHTLDALTSFFDSCSVDVVDRHVTVPHLFVPFGRRAFSPLLSRLLRASNSVAGHPVRVYFVLRKR